LETTSSSGGGAFRKDTSSPQLASTRAAKLLAVDDLRDEALSEGEEDDYTPRGSASTGLVSGAWGRLFGKGKERKPKRGGDGAREYSETFDDD